jgi:hypothetical protein
MEVDGREGDEAVSGQREGSVINAGNLSSGSQGYTHRMRQSIIDRTCPFLKTDK